jgi:hypothetical protein
MVVAEVTKTCRWTVMYDTTYIIDVHLFVYYLV